MRLTLSKRVLLSICTVALIISAVNSYFIFDLTRSLRDVARYSDYDYLIFQDGDIIRAKDLATDSVDISSANASLVINQAVARATSVYIDIGNYSIDSDVQVRNKQNVRIVGNGASINCNGNRLLVKGDDYTYSQNNIVSGLTIVNGTIRIENSFGTTVSKLLFENCSTALEFANTKTWSEGTKIEDCRFINSTASIVFRTPAENITGSIVTGSYASTEIRRCFFNLPNDSVGIHVEQDAELSDSQIQNVRFWIGEKGFERNQTGLLVDGTMHQSLLLGVVFESFAYYPDDLYGIVLGETSVTPPILAGGVSFLGEGWTAKIHNPFYKWIAGSGSLFRKDDISIAIGANGQYGTTEKISIDPLTVYTFKSKIQISGSFNNNETITVRFRLEFLDNTNSSAVEKSFNETETLWLSDDDLLEMYPSQSIIWRILVDAKVNSASTDAVAKVSVYGAAT